MQSKAITVNEYLDEVPESRKEALHHLRECCRKILPGYTESMQYGMPCYSKENKVEVAFASQKNYIALYCLKESVVKDHPELLKGLKYGKGCIRFPSPNAMRFDVIDALLKLTFEAAEYPC